MLSYLILAVIIAATFTYILLNVCQDGCDFFPQNNLNSLRKFDYAACDGEQKCFPRANVSGMIKNECVTKSIKLWSKVGGEGAGGHYLINLRGCPGTHVTVRNVEKYNGEYWYDVLYEGSIHGELDVRLGWVPETVVLAGPLPMTLEEYNERTKTRTAERVFA